MKNNNKQSPTIDGKNKKVFLAGLNIGDWAVILKVPNHSLFAPLGIREGKRINLESKHAFSGPFLINIDGRQVAVSRHIAKYIEVEECLENSR